MPSNGVGTDSTSNLNRLREAGLITCGDDELAEPYARAVDGLTPHEVDVLLAVKKRLDAADAWQGQPPVNPGEMPPFTVCIVF